jgi:ABC-2 type transport system permease protein
VIWLEAHRQDPAMFRPAEDAPELRRLADLSVAGVLTMLLPLLMFLMGAGAFAAERERGTLRQILSTGPAINAIFAGKLAIVAGMGAGIACLALAVSIGVAVLAPSGSSAWDILARGAGLMVGYSLYSLACAGVALVVSARARSTTSALLILLSVWALSVVILPRVAASLAAHIHPTPDSGTFWTRTSSAIRANQPARKSEEYRALERQVLSRALGREITADEAASLNLNRAGLYLEISEVLGARAYSDAYQDLYANYENQQRLRRLVSIFSPAISLQHFSSAISGTDSAAHRHFASEAERQRQLVIRTMNEDMMLNGAGQGNAYLSSADFWERIPDFVYRAPSASVAIRSAVWDLLVLAAWSVVAFWLAWRSACRQSVV